MNGRGLLQLFYLSSFELKPNLFKNLVSFVLDLDSWHFHIKMIPHLERALDHFKRLIRRNHFLILRLRYVWFIRIKHCFKISSDRRCNEIMLCSWRIVRIGISAVYVIIKLFSLMSRIAWHILSPWNMKQHSIKKKINNHAWVALFWIDGSCSSVTIASVVLQCLSTLG